MTQRSNDISLLNKDFRRKFDLRWKEVATKYPNAVVFEAYRSQARQDRLYAQGRTRPGNIVTRTKKSNHTSGKAVDIVFMNNGKLERKGPYTDLIEIAKKYNIRNLAPTELCHFEDDGTPYIQQPIINQEAQKAIDLGITNGDRPKDFATREEVATMIYRLYQKITGKAV